MSRILPILFNTEMVQAILDRKKTVTRRCVKYKYSNTEMKMRTDKYGTRLIEIQKDVEGETFGKNPDGTTWHKLLGYIEPKAPYQLGDILYVRETWKCWRAHRYEANADIMFKAGGDGVRLQFANGSTDSINREDYDRFIRKWYSYHGEWKPSIYMPKEAARIWLKVTDVRVELLQEITIDGVIKEGCADLWIDEAKDMKLSDVAGDKNQFTDLWNSTIKKSDIDFYGWDANPLVWVIEFEKCKKPEGM